MNGLNRCQTRFDALPVGLGIAVNALTFLAEKLSELLQYHVSTQEPTAIFYRFSDIKAISVYIIHPIFWKFIKVWWIAHQIKSANLNKSKQMWSVAIH
mmetsp:Transcript_24840/g.71761  ORF Transcript_24840/g.71761 Transcript_24840/m.71761 type:complete len:98 (+) Transcript_24840:106-399(+)